VNLTPHFTLAEMTTTSTRLDNLPDGHEICCLRSVCSAVLEPWRERVGPLKVNSGFRSALVNAAVDSSSKSQHIKGEAADVVPLHTPRIEAWHTLLDMIAAGLPVDQAIIYEDHNHIHVSHTARYTARRQVLVHMPGSYISWAKWLQLKRPPLT